MSARDIIYPGATLGVLGSGQLGRMFALEARRMGYRVHTYSDAADTPTGHISDKEYTGSYDDLDAVRSFARGVEVVTFEFENVPSATAAAAAECAPVRPGGEVLHITQHRLREKTFLQKHGFPLPPFRLVTSLDLLEAGLAELGCPAVLKSAGWGYDGKGQVKITAPDQAAAAWESLGGQDAVLEAFVDFEREASVVAVRGADGSYTDFGLFENEHVNHILDVTLSPGRFSVAVVEQAQALAREIVEALNVVGVLCVELFVTRDGGLLVNELAPRPHNSGHVTLDQCETSQFEQQVRAICGLPLGSSRPLCPAVMVNLLGDLWSGGEPHWERACAVPGVKLHLYGKREARLGRKMGHLTAVARDVDTARARALEARKALTD
ncbi:MAG: 5-(carboxyamino)imidazole ribonucleotide synthase [Candidatus Hydrogenedens sp.]|nr:5-(carboxyamino)imidazole ribonucleotide synthase [Candidatus Hydrogenedens sp.]